MPPQHKLRHLAGAEELNRKVEEISRRIRTLMEKRDIDHKTLGEALGITANAVTKIIGGNTIQYAKLCRLAEALGADPNEILGYQPGVGRGLLTGVLEGTVLALGLAREEAREIARIAIGVLDAPSTSADAEERGRNVAEYVVQQYLDSKRR